LVCDDNGDRFWRRTSQKPVRRSNLGNIYHGGGNMKKAKFHLKAVAMAGDKGARNNQGLMEVYDGNKSKIQCIGRLGISWM
jgi:hypothetical protein